jgi:hypothetical protein
VVGDALPEVPLDPGSLVPAASVELAPPAPDAPGASSDEGESAAEQATTRATKGNVVQRIMV